MEWLFFSDGSNWRMTAQFAGEHDSEWRPMKRPSHSEAHDGLKRRFPIAVLYI